MRCWLRCGTPASASLPKDEKRIFDAFFTTKAARDGNGIVNQPFHHRGSRWPVVGQQQQRLWRDASIHAAGGPGSDVMKDSDPIVFVVDDDASVRDAVKKAHRVGRLAGGDIRIDARVSRRQAPGGAGVPGAGCAAAGRERA